MEWSLYSRRSYFFIISDKIINKSLLKIMSTRAVTVTKRYQIFGLVINSVGKIRTDFGHNQVRILGSRLCTPTNWQKPDCNGVVRMCFSTLCYCLLDFSLLTCTQPLKLVFVTSLEMCGNGSRITSMDLATSRLICCMMTSPRLALMDDTTWSWCVILLT